MNKFVKLLDKYKIYLILSIGLLLLILYLKNRKELFSLGGQKMDRKRRKGNPGRFKRINKGRVEINGSVLENNDLDLLNRKEYGADLNAFRESERNQNLKNLSGLLEKEIETEEAIKVAEDAIGLAVLAEEQAEKATEVFKCWN